MRESWRFARWVFIGVACSAQAYGSCYFCMPDQGQVNRSASMFVVRGQFESHCALPPKLQGIAVRLFRGDAEAPEAETFTDPSGRFRFQVTPPQAPAAEHGPIVLRIVGGHQTMTVRPAVADLIKEYAVTFEAPCSSVP